MAARMQRRERRVGRERGFFGLLPTVGAAASLALSWSIRASWSLICAVMVDRQCSICFISLTLDSASSFHLAACCQNDFCEVQVKCTNLPSYWV